MMKTLNYATFALSLALTMNLSPLAARDEEGGKHEVLVHVSGGMTVPISGPRNGGMDGDDFGLKAGAGYIYNLNERWGLMTGMEFANFSGRISYSKFVDSYTVKDYAVTQPSNVTYSYIIGEYREAQSISMVALPIMLRMRTRLDNNTTIYYAAGCKVGIPVSAQAKISGKLISSANFDHENVTYSNLPGHDFFDGENFGSQAKDVKVNPAAILSLESGLRFSIGRVLMYAALNFDCSLNNIKGTSDKHPLNFTETGLYCESLLNTPFTNRLKITSMGLKIGFGFN